MTDATNKTGEGDAMTIDEAQRRRQALQETIRNAVVQFTFETNLWVTSVALDVYTAEASDGTLAGATYLVKVRVEL